MRGEQCLIRLSCVCRRGSPPLARGTDNRNAEGWRFCGITPACAGNRYVVRVACCVLWDHPRLRGEQEVSCIARPTTQGSPPLARGTAESCKNIAAGAGITPACAGNSFNLMALNLSRWDHPRLRGEQNSLVCVFLPRKGSPPLARGTEISLQVKICVSGITPACAGNSWWGYADMRNVWGSPPLARGTDTAAWPL